MRGRTFKDKNKVAEVIRRYKAGEGLTSLGRRFKCDHTSVLALLKRCGAWRKGQRGAYTKPVKIEPESGEIIEAPTPPPTAVFKYAHLLDEGPINPGKRYAEYLKHYQKEIAPLRKQRMADARETIRAIRSKFGKVRYTQDEVVLNA